jgi:hypothetical protein
MWTDKIYSAEVLEVDVREATVVAHGILVTRKWTLSNGDLNPFANTYWQDLYLRV